MGGRAKAAREGQQVHQEKDEVGRCTVRRIDPGLLERPVFMEGEGSYVVALAVGS